MDENNAALPPYEPYPDGHRPTADEALDDAVWVVAFALRRIRAGLDPLIAPEHVKLARESMTPLAAVVWRLRNPVEDTDRLRAIVEKMRADGVGVFEARN